MSAVRLERLRLGPLREGAFTSRLHTERLAALLGVALGVSFSICFATGLLSHLIQQPPAWFHWPSRPAGLYRVTQGLHIATGIATIPLLLAKLWTVFPKLWTWPPVEGVLHALERVALVPLVAGSVFQLFSGVANIARWYPYPFFFTSTHYWVAWLTMGALLVHIGAKLPTTRDALSPARERARPPEPAGDGLSRRGLLGWVAATAGILTVGTVGETLGPLRRLSVIAPRRPDVGAQGLPVNTSALRAGVTEVARDPAWRLTVEGRVQTPLSLSLADIRAMPHREATLPISCVEGWSASARWRGVPVADVLRRAGARPGARVVVESLQRDSIYAQSTLNRAHASDPDTLLAYEVNGETLNIDHGFPLRLIGPNRPGVMQTKWLHRMVVR
jgi:hypothetical protein